jgi:phosphoribosylanthranilate isomerase
MRVKICGITQTQQAVAIAELGATALGFICVSSSPRYLEPQQIQHISSQLPPSVHRIGVFVNATLEQIIHTVTLGHLTGIQLHGNEDPSFCQTLSQQLPQIELIKAFRVRTPETLNTIHAYQNSVHTLLLDAYHPHQFGGTGQTLNWQDLISFSPPLPWFLAGGLTPDNIQQALEQLSPQGIDLSSGVELKPGDKDLQKVRQLFQKLERLSRCTSNLKLSVSIESEDNPESI